MLEQMFRYMDLANGIQRRAHPEFFRAIDQGEPDGLEAEATSDASTESVEDQEALDGTKRTPVPFRTGKRVAAGKDRADEG
jgi:hypothetical protein